jgi:hypothetical protein
MNEAIRMIAARIAEAASGGTVNQGWGRKTLILVLVKLEGSSFRAK